MHFIHNYTPLVMQGYWWRTVQEISLQLIQLLQKMSEHTPNCALKSARDIHYTLFVVTLFLLQTKNSARNFSAMDLIVKENVGNEFRQKSYCVHRQNWHLFLSTNRKEGKAMHM